MPPHLQFSHLYLRLDALSGSASEGLRCPSATNVGVPRQVDDYVVMSQLHNIPIHVPAGHLLPALVASLLLWRRTPTSPVEILVRHAFPTGRLAGSLLACDGVAGPPKSGSRRGCAGDARCSLSSDMDVRSRSDSAGCAALLLALPDEAPAPGFERCDLEN